MRQLTSSGQQQVNKIAQQHGFGPAAVSSMLESVANGNGTMAQFNHPEFGGSGQWMKGGMTMVSDMFNSSLKDRVNRLCGDLSDLLARNRDLFDTAGSASDASGNQGNGAPRGDWWPRDLHSPNSTGSQNAMRYAYFAQAHRLAIDDHGKVTVYDTLDHQISGVSQQQSSGSSVKFSSQRGTVDVGQLPVVS